MKLVGSESELNFESEIVSLGRLCPIVNGERIEAPFVVDQLSSENCHALCKVANGVFQVTVHSEGESCALTYSLEGLPEDLVLDSFGICFTGAVQSTEG